MRRTKRSKNTGSEFRQEAPEASRIDVTVTWKMKEENPMNLFAVVLVGADHVIERLWKVAKSPEDVLIELGRDGVQPEQIVTVDFCVSLSPENVAMYES